MLPDPPELLELPWRPDCCLSTRVRIVIVFITVSAPVTPPLHVLVHTLVLVAVNLKSAAALVAVVAPWMLAMVVMVVLVWMAMVVVV